MNAEQRAALERLLQVASAHHGASKIAADFLLAWWNGHDNGGFELTETWALDSANTRAMVVLFAFIATNQVYPDELGYGDQFRALWDRWRKPKRRRKA